MTVMMSKSQGGGEIIQRIPNQRADDADCNVYEAQTAGYDQFVKVRMVRVYTLYDDDESRYCTAV